MGGCRGCKYRVPFSSALLEIGMNMNLIFALSQDEEAIARERAEAIERARIEHERAEAARREEEERRRREAEEVARREEEERVRKDAAAATTATTNKLAPRGRGTGASMNSGVRGVRGTRASAAAMAARSGGRGIPRGAGTSREFYIAKSCLIGIQSGFSVDRCFDYHTDTLD